MKVIDTRAIQGSSQKHLEVLGLYQYRIAVGMFSHIMMTTLLRKTLIVTSAKVYGYLKEINHPPSIVNCPAAGLTFRKIAVGSYSQSVPII